MVENRVYSLSNGSCSRVSEVLLEILESDTF